MSNPWARFLLRRLLGLVAVLSSLVVIVFFAIHLVPGDPLVNVIGAEASPDSLARLRKQYGLDDSLFWQFVHYVGHLLHGDLGRTYIYNYSVWGEIRAAIPNSLQLASGSFIAIFVCGVAIGMISAALTRDGRRRKFEIGLTGVSSIVSAIPDYLMATILVFFFAVEFRLFPVAGTRSLGALVLPVAAVSLHSIATLVRIVRVETLNVLAQDYIRTARSDRLPNWIILFRYALPNVLTAALTLGGVIFANILGGTIIVEVIFTRPGLGSLLVKAILEKEYPLVQGIMLLLGFVVVVTNLLIDLVLAMLDPRSLTREA